MKAFIKYVKLQSSPEDVYNALVNPVMLEIWTGEPAVMSEEPGSPFSLWDGSITGTNKAFEKNRLIRQEWDFGEEYPSSEVTLLLHPDGDGTRLEIRHTGIPDAYFDNMSEGWVSDYIGGLRQLFED